MRILAIGDVVGNIGCRFLRKRLPALKKLKGVDLVIANGENSADGNGVTPISADFLFSMIYSETSLFFHRYLYYSP